ncbi:MAG: ABC transporter ATP-binding protein [Geminicoccaceae bacterium]|nr:ABC transporter ATP-binding protein [Geminicoccaceae bacterium]HRY23719.1 ABC transporter ATP-binding protein [Geminicoccaceae bacterium]
MTVARLVLSGIKKAYPGALANDDVALTVGQGEIHALLGENGAGKSTLVKIIYGVLAPDAGEIAWEGRPVTIPSPHAARTLGIGMVFQHFSLFDALTVLENVALGLDAKLDRRTLAERITKVSQAYGLPLDPHREVHELSVGERQRIEIVRCLLQSPRLLIMDEPTSVLTPQEVERLFSTLRQLAKEGVSILYISHKLHEIEALCDAATIMRGGKVVAHCDPRTETARSMAELMVGSSFAAPEKPTRRLKRAPRFSVNALDLPTAEVFGTALREISFDVQVGEIFGIAGVAGNGQSELLAALSGERLTEPGFVVIDGQKVGRLGPRARRMHGLAYIPEERNGHAAVPDLTLAGNALLSAFDRRGLLSSGVIRHARASAFAQEIIDRFSVRATGPTARASALSGGNLQKFVVGREILQAPNVLIAAQPTWGVDAGAAAAIHQALIDLAGHGVAVLVVSQDLDELMALTDRMAVLNGGRLSRPLVTAEATVEQIGLLMGGLHDLPDEVPQGDGQPETTHG